MSTTKSGWLEKYSGTIFKSWKRRYCVLYTDGEFSIYDEPNKATADTRIRMQKECKQIGVGFACGAINLPKGQSSVDALFCIKTKQGKEHYFAAASDRECNEWVGALEHARNIQINHSKTVPQAPYPDQQGVPPPPYVAAPPQQPQQLMYQQQQQYAYQPAPGYVQPAPGYPQPAAGYPQPAPGYPQAAPGYVQPGYGQPRYVYVQGPPPQQQQSSNNSTRNMMLGAAGGGLAGFALGSMMTGGFGHHGFGHHDSFDHGFDHDFDCGGGFDGGFDF